MGYPIRLIDRLFLIVWDIVLHLGLPLALFYLWKRARKEPVYAQHLAERFGGGDPISAGAIWIHAVSLGEVRAARPVIDALLARGERVLITNMTAAGRNETMAVFADAIETGQVTVRWNPIDLSWTCARFIRRHRPAFGMIMEIELWPRMIASANRARLPMVLAQAQYPQKSFLRDQGWLGLRAHLVRGFDLILAKSDRHAQRFRHFGAQNVAIMGELRFEQPIPQHLLEASQNMRAQIDPGRRVFCLASIAPDEDDLLIPVLVNLRRSAQEAGRNPPFFVYVPRHPKDFARTAERLEAAGLTFARRSTHLDDDLSAVLPFPPDLDGLFGDSLGEIYFYFALSDTVFIGDSFNGEGSHNIIEPLSVGKSLVVGPSIWGIEFPAVEAMKEGILTMVDTPEDLFELWNKPQDDQDNPALLQFISRHRSATDRAITYLVAAGLLAD